MTDRYLIPFGDRFLALDAEAFARALAEGDRAVPPRADPGLARSPEPSPLLDARGIALALGVAVSAVRERSRRGEIPVVRVGRHHRFDLGAVRQALDQLSAEQSAVKKAQSDQHVAGHGFTGVSRFSGPGGRPVGARNGR